jgi:aminomethyltransferase
MRTVLYSKHVLLGAKIVDFAGWRMPVQYMSILDEHSTVRKQVGLFDVSHMGIIDVRGRDAEKFIEYLSTNIILNKPDFCAIYTVFCNEKGGCVDDVIVFKINSQHLFVVTNASNREKDFNHLLTYSKGFSVKIEDRFKDHGILALQGPNADSVMRDIFGTSILHIKPMRFLITTIEGSKVVLARTGYTGSGGFEIYANNKIISTLWDEILAKGAKYGIKPIGLGARDTLRLEMGFALFDHELDDTIAPTESVSSWTVKWQKDNFIGKQALLELETSGKKRHQYGIVLQDSGVARCDYPVLNKGKVIGKITSGSFSPTLNKSIAIAIVDPVLAIKDGVGIQIRDKIVSANVVDVPFVKTKQGAYDKVF